MGATGRPAPRNMVMCLIDPSMTGLVKELDQDISHLGLSRCRFFEQVIQKHEKLLDEGAIEKAKAEVAAFALITRGDSFPGYYQPLAVFTDGTTFPSRQYFDWGRLEYLAERARCSSNPINAARYADVVWDLSEKKDVEMARFAIDEHLKCAEIYKKAKLGTEFENSLKRAASLSSMINDKSRLAETKNAILRYFGELDAKQEYRYCLSLSDSIAVSRLMALTDEEWKKVLVILDNAATYYGRKHAGRADAFGPVEGPSEHFIRSFHEAKLNLSDRTSLINADSERLAIARSYEREGDSQAAVNNYLAAEVSYIKAEEGYRNIGSRDDTSRVRIKLAKVGIRTEAQMRPISATITITDTEMDDFIRPLLGTTLEDTLMRVASARRFIPNVSVTQKHIEELKQEFPISFLIPRIESKNGYIVGVHAEGDEIENAALTSELVMHIQLGQIFLGYLFDKLRSNYHLDPSSLVKHFEDWQLCRAQNLALLKAGFDRYFSNDHVSAIHILVFQFESVLRNLLQIAERPIAIPGQRLATLGSLLDDEVFANVAGIDLKRYYELVLSDSQGLNLRNDVAHGLMKPESMNKSVVELVIYLLLTLTRFRVERSRPG